MMRSLILAFYSLGRQLKEKEVLPPFIHLTTVLKRKNALESDTRFFLWAYIPQKLWYKNNNVTTMIYW